MKFVNVECKGRYMPIIAENQIGSALVFKDEYFGISGFVYFIHDEHMLKAIQKWSCIELQEDYESLDNLINTWNVKYPDKTIAKTENSAEISNIIKNELEVIKSAIVYFHNAIISDDFKGHYF